MLVVLVYDQLRKRRIIGRVQAGPCSRPYWCLQTFVGCAGESPPRRRSAQ